MIRDNTKKLSLLLCLVMAAVMMSRISVTAFAQEDATEPAETRAAAAVAEAVDTAAEAVAFTDALGREVSFTQPRRVVAMIGSFADVWCLAGGEQVLAATAEDAWSSFGLELDDSVVNLGSVKEPNMELVISLEPDLVLASTNIQSNLEFRDTFEAAGVPVAYFDIQSLEDYLHMLDICTRLTGKPENYALYGTDVAARCEAAIARQDGSAPRVLCLRATGSSVKVKGSEDFVLGEMLADLGCVNVADGNDALLEELSLEAILAADPDYIFAVPHGPNQAEAQASLDKTLLNNPAWQTLRAVREGRYYMLDYRLYNLKPNALWGDSYEGLADILYGEE